MNDYDYRKTARDALKGKWATAIGVSFIASLLGAGSNFDFSFSANVSSDINRYDPEALKVILPFLVPIVVILGAWSILTLIIGGAVEVGNCQFYLNLTDGKPAEFKDLFSKFNIFGKTLALKLLTTLYVFLWSLLCLIPGIIAAYSYAMAPYILAENPDITASEAISRSKRMMQGNKVSLFILQLSFIGWAILAVLSCGIGLLWLEPYISAATAAFYRQLANSDISKRNEQSLNQQ